MTRRKVNVKIQLVVGVQAGHRLWTDPANDPVYQVGTMFQFRQFEGDVYDLRKAIKRKEHSLMQNIGPQHLRVFRGGRCCPVDKLQTTFCLGGEAVKLDCDIQISELNLTEEECLIVVAPCGFHIWRAH